jgi:hypothetical protein
MRHRWEPSRAIGLVVIVVLAEIVNANVLSTQGDATKYGQLNVPESKVLELPAASFEGILEDDLEEDLALDRHRRRGLARPLAPRAGRRQAQARLTSASKGAARFVR